MPLQSRFNGTERWMVMGMAKFPTMEEFAKEAAERALDDFEYKGKTIRELAELILSGKLVEVVRCRDCKYGEYDYTEFFDYYECRYIGGDWNRGDHFCAYGERKDNG